jgi:hypothetical protein
MFQFPRCPSRGLCIRPPMTTLARRRVAPFGFGRLFARLQLPAHVSPLSASFLGTWPQRHPPSTLPRLACLQVTMVIHRAPRTSKRESSLRPLGRTIHLRSWNSLASAKSKQITLPRSHSRTKRCTRSARGRFRDKVYILVLRLFRCYDADPDHIGRRPHPRMWRHLRNTKFCGHPLRVPWHLDRVNPSAHQFAGAGSPAPRTIMPTRRLTGCRRCRR